MPHSEATRLFPYDTEQVFALVANIERYPEFVPGYRSARILARDGHRLRVEQLVGIGPLQQRFVSEAELTPPQGLRVQSRDVFFKQFSIDWRFTPQEHGCRVRLKLQAELRSLPLQLLASGLAAFSAEQQLDCFLARAHQLYGRQASG